MLVCKKNNSFAKQCKVEREREREGKREREREREVTKAYTFKDIHPEMDKTKTRSHRKDKSDETDRTGKKTKKRPFVCLEKVR